MNTFQSNSGNRPLAPIDALTEIAKRQLNIETLEERQHDALDFHDCAVWSIKAALKDAYLLGHGDGRRIGHPVLALTRDHLAQAGFESRLITDQELESLAGKLANSYEDSSPES